MNIEAMLTQRIGDAGKRLHTGRSRNDQVAVDTRLYVKQEIPVIIDQILNLEQVLVERAKERLMARNGMTEEEAHRALRRRSMDCRIPLADAARMLLDGERPAP